MKTSSQTFKFIPRDFTVSKKFAKSKSDLEQIYFYCHALKLWSDTAFVVSNNLILFGILKPSD